MSNDSVIIYSFQEVLQMLANKKKPTLLLGNGFSVAFQKNIFSFGSLFERAQEQGLFQRASQVLPNIFTQSNTVDFEFVMLVLRHFLIVATLYNVDTQLINIIQNDINFLKQILVETIAKNHPDSPSEIADDQYSSCFSFINNFKSIYSLNYDLLLYWVIMKYLNLTNFKDGFHDSYSDEDDDTEYVMEDYVIWPTASSVSADIYFLHGALHLYDAGYEIRKFCWSRTGVKLKDQVLEALDKSMFPIFISEGDAKSKLEKITHNGYLLKALRSLAKISGSLVIFGFGLKDNDKHIIDAIVNSTVDNIYISIFGDPASMENKLLIEQAKKMVHRRELLVHKKKKKIGLNIYFYDAASAKVWG